MLFIRDFDYEKILTVGMPLLYEVGRNCGWSPRWNWNPTVVWADLGSGGMYAEAEVLSIYKDTMCVNLPKLHGVSLKDKINIPMSDKAVIGAKAYHPMQWEWDGFFKPDPDWKSYAPVKPRKQCSCGAEAFARHTNQPVTGHGLNCQKWEPNPYTGARR